ncbi:hypothetical protein AX16_004569 [Volvariella volvacea WC 439]|nr:hypothetical protein AX16_004569 [Volvariella volvacea WC 439]
MVYLALTKDPIDALYEAFTPQVRHESGIVDRCLEGTRIGVISDIVSWIQDVTSTSRILWLTGSIRVGKTCIAATVAKKFFDEKQLMGDYFLMDRKPGRSDSVSGIAVAIALRLCFFSEEAHQYITRTVRDDPTVLQAHTEVQWQKLVLDTLQSVTKRQDFRPVIVLDGVEGCKPQEDQVWVIDKLVNLCRQFPIALVISSRPEWHLKQKFTELQSRYPALFRPNIELGDSDEAPFDMRAIVLDNLQPLAQRLIDTEEHKRHEIEEAFIRYFSIVNGQYVVSHFVSRHMPLIFETGFSGPSIDGLRTDDELDAAIYIKLDHDVYHEFMTFAYSHLTGTRVDMCYRLLFHLLHIRAESINGLSAFWGYPLEEVHNILRPFHSVLRVPIADRQPITFRLFTFQKFLSSRYRGGKRGQYFILWPHYCVDAVERSLIIAGRHQEVQVLPEGMAMLWLTICPQLSIKMLSKKHALRKRVLKALRQFDFSFWIQQW